jgi:hypothetical protein
MTVSNNLPVTLAKLPKELHNRNPWPAVDYRTVHSTVIDCPMHLKEL